MRRTICAVLLAAVACGTAGAADWKKVRIATEGAYAPWNYKDAAGNLAIEIDSEVTVSCKCFGLDRTSRRSEELEPWRLFRGLGLRQLGLSHRLWACSLRSHLRQPTLQAQSFLVLRL